jgi:H+/Cl- antiporter ClcA
MSEVKAHARPAAPADAPPAGLAAAVAAVAIGFAALANRAIDLFVQFQAPRPWVAFIVCPAGRVASCLLTRHIFPGAHGNGIPQVIAVQHMTDREAIARVLSPRQWLPARSR